MSSVRCSRLSAAISLAAADRREPGEKWEWALHLAIDRRRGGLAGRTNRGPEAKTGSRSIARPSQPKDKSERQTKGRWEGNSSSEKRGVL
jgi:hypothetical protein